MLAKLSNRHGTDPYAWWCGRGGVARRPPIPINPRESLNRRVGITPNCAKHSVRHLPPRAPELNPQENIWQFMRANSLSNRVFKSYDDIVDHCCYAWNTLVDQPLATKPVDFRKGMDGLAALVQEQLKADPFICVGC